MTAAGRGLRSTADRRRRPRRSGRGDRHAAVRLRRGPPPGPCREAVEAWGDGVAYATKAFLCMAMARLAHEEGMCLDVSTGGELHVALSAGVPADRLVLHGNNKSDERAGRRRWTPAWAASSSTPSTRSTASSGLLAEPAQPAPAAGRRPKVLARITPGVEVHTHEFVRTGQDDSKFGFGLAVGGGRRSRSTGCRSSHAAGHRRVRGDPRPPGQPGLRPRPLRPGHRGAGRVLRSPRPSRAGGRRRARRGLRQRGGGPAHGPVGRLGAPGLPGGRVSPTRSGSPPSRGGPSWRRPPSPSTGWAPSRTCPATGPTCRWTAG